LLVREEKKAALARLLLIAPPLTLPSAMMDVLLIGVVMTFAGVLLFRTAVKGTGPWTGPLLSALFSFIMIMLVMVVVKVMAWGGW
jgi:hypothetical protein